MGLLRVGLVCLGSAFSVLVLSRGWCRVVLGLLQGRTFGGLNSVSLGALCAVRRGFSQVKACFVSCGLVGVPLMFGSRLRVRARGNRKVVTVPGKVDVTVRAFGYRAATENSHFNDAKRSKWE